MQATYFGAKKLKGIRAAVYLNAMRYNACYSLDRSKSIWYDDDSDDLQIALLFKSEAEANTFLSLWHMDNPLVVQNDAISVLEKMDVVPVAESELCYVLIRHYECGNTDSPIQTLAEFRGLPSSTNTSLSAVSLSDPVVQFQCIENLSAFGRVKPYRCHIKAKEKFKALKDNDNNIISGSWTPFHQCFGGLNTEDIFP